MDAVDEFSTYFKAAEMPRGKRLTLTITTASKEVMSDGKAKLVLGFEETNQRLILNVGNRSELVARFGRNTDDWIGQQVTLVTQRVQGPNGMTWGIRFQELPSTTGNAHSAADVAEDIDDELPAKGGGTRTADGKPARPRSFN